MTNRPAKEYILVVRNCLPTVKQGQEDSEKDIVQLHSVCFDRHHSIPTDSPHVLCSVYLLGQANEESYATASNIPGFAARASKSYIAIHIFYIILCYTRSYAALRVADLDWIIGPGYSFGGYILEKNHEKPTWNHEKP